MFQVNTTSICHKGNKMNAFKELFTEMRGSFNISEPSSAALGNAMSKHADSRMQTLLGIKKKFKGQEEPETFQPSGVAGDGYKMVLYRSKNKKHTIKIEYYSPRSGWKLSIHWGDKGTYSDTYDQVELKNLSISEVEAGLQKLANNLPADYADNSKFGGRAKYSDTKWPAVFNKRILK